MESLIAIVPALLILLQRASAQIPCAPPSTWICPGSSCCGKNGYCGIGENYCGIGNCLSQCPLTVQSYYPPPELPAGAYYYYPPPELPVEEEIEPVEHGRHSLAWWLGIIAAVAVVAAGIFAACWLVTRSVSRHRKCECDS